MSRHTPYNEYGRVTQDIFSLNNHRRYAFSFPLVSDVAVYGPLAARSVSFFLTPAS